MKKVLSIQFNEKQMTDNYSKESPNESMMNADLVEEEAVSESEPSISKVHPEAASQQSCSPTLEVTNGAGKPLHVISLGAGVQSSTMALMAAEGLIEPMPDFAVFADTGDEPKEVYEWLEKLRDMVPFRIKIAHRGNLFGKLSDHITEWDHSQIPCFKINPDTGVPGLGKRQCTKHWKIIPVQQKIREVTNTQRKQLPKGFVTLWMGISTDEITRAKLSRDKWITNRFPLLEKRMGRYECLLWLDKRGLRVPKSACVYCPFRTDDQWRKSLEIPAERELILRIDRKLNARGEFLHPSCVPIDQVDFSTMEQRGYTNLFANECEGMCGV